MKKLLGILLAFAMLFSCAAQAEMIIIGESAAPESAVIGEPILTDELELQIHSLTNTAPANNYTHQAVTLVLSLSNWSMETFNADESLAFNITYEDLVYPGVCMQGSGILLESLMSQTFTFTSVIPNALMYAEEAEFTEFTLTVDGVDYAFTPDQFSEIGDTLVATTCSAEDPCFALIKADGSLWTWGSNVYGQLGDGTTTSRSTPVQVLDDVIAVAADRHMLALRADGTLWTWGRNEYGQLGDGTTTDRAVPQQILDNVVSIATGSSRSAAVRADGTLWMWGSNYDGCLGDGSKADTAVPKQIMDNVLAAAPSDGSHMLVLRADGTAWGCGYNGDGRIGDGTRNNHIELLQAQTDVTSLSTGLTHSAIIRTDGTLWSTDGQGGYIQIMENAVDVSAGVYYTLTLDASGTLWGWGNNDHGQLGYGSASAEPVVILENVMDFNAGAYGAIAVCTDGSVWTWGWNAGGSYEDGTVQDSPLPTKLPLNFFS